MKPSKLHLRKAFLPIAVTFAMAASMLPAASLAFAADGEEAASDSAQAAEQQSSSSSATTATGSSAEKIATLPVAAAMASSKDTQAADNDEAAESPAASIGTTTYATLKTALTSAHPGDTVKLLKDANLNGAGVINMPGVTLDLQGHTISADNMSVIFEGSGAKICNGTAEATNNGSYALFIGDEDETDGFTLENLDVKGGVNIYNASDVVLRNVNVDASATNSKYYAIWCDVNAQATIESGTYKSNGTAIVGLTTSHEDVPASTLQIEGGTFETDASSPVVLSGDSYYKPVITGGTFPNSAEPAKYEAEGYAVMPEDGQYAVLAQSGSVQADAAKAQIPDGMELVVIGTTDDENARIADDATHPDIAAELAKAGGTANLWEVNVIYRDKTTLQEDHDDEVSFVLAYPDGLDSQAAKGYTFKVMHLKQTGEGASATETPEIIDDSKVSPETDGLHITSTLSPLAISYGKANSTTDDSTTPAATTTQTADSAQSATTQAAAQDDGSSSTATASATTTASGTASTDATPAQVIAEATAAAAEAEMENMQTDTSVSFTREHTGELVEVDNIPAQQAAATEQFLGMVLAALALAFAIAGLILLVKTRNREDRNSR